MDDLGSQISLLQDEEKEDLVTRFINKLPGPTKKMVEALMCKYGEVVEGGLGFWYWWGGNDGL